MLNKKRLFTALGILFSLLVVGLVILSWFLRAHLTEFISTEIKVYGLLITFVISALLEIIPQWLSPHFILINAAVIGLPSFTSFLMVALGSTIGDFVGLWLGRKYGYELARQAYGKKKINKVKKMMNSHGRWIVTVSAFTPLPYIPLVFGTLGMKRKEFIIYGLIPRILSYLLIWLIVLYNIDIPLI